MKVSKPFSHISVLYDLHKQIFIVHYYCVQANQILFSPQAFNIPESFLLPLAPSLFFFSTALNMARLLEW